MGLLADFLNPAPRAETGGGTPAPDADFWYNAVGGVDGYPVSPEVALQLDAVFACCRVLCESAGILPFITYRRLPNGGKARATDDPRYDLLRWQPDGRTTAQAYWEMVVLHLLLRGAHTAVKVYDSAGALLYLAPLHPDRVEAKEVPSGRIVYHHRSETGGIKTYTAEQVFRVTFMTLDGVQPLSVLQAAARATRLGLDAEHYARTAFTNDPTSQLAIISKAGWKSEADRKEFRESLIRRGTGPNRNKPLVIGGDADVKQLRMTMEELQLLETRTFSRRQIASIFRVPLHMIGDLERSTNNNIEHQGLEFTTLELSPWLVRIEQAVRLQLFAGEDDLFAEFLTDALVRGDIEARHKAYQSGINSGWLTRNEARERENLNPLPGLDAPLEPENMRNAGDRRAAQIAQRQVRRQVRQEAEALGKLARQHANDDAAWQRAVREYFDHRPAELVQALSLTPAAARRVTERHRDAVLARGLALFEAQLDGWEAGLFDAIMEDDDGTEDQSAA